MIGREPSTKTPVNLKNKRVLVVGAAGFIGRHVVKALEAAGAAPVGFDFAGPAFDQEQIPWITGSVSDPALFATAVSGCYGVVFLANSSLPNTANFALAAEVSAHVHSSVNAAEICCNHGVQRFVFASSGGTVYGHDSDTPIPETALTEPRNAYGVSKLAIEHYLRLLHTMRGMQTVSLRISNPYGEGQRAHRNQGFIAAAFNHLKCGSVMPIWGDGTVERDFIHVSDVARAFLCALVCEESPRVINIGAGAAKSLLQILQEIKRVAGKPVPVAFQPGRVVDVKRNVLCIDLARERLDWQPKVTLLEGLARTASWWEEHEDH